MPNPMPDHMDRGSRIERLHAFLKNMGLYVSPMFVDGELDSLHVAVDLPRYSTEQPTEASVNTPVKGAEIVEAVASAERDGMNVIDFPPIV